jgi:ABC-type spermidine/putrescine transport system permease subunit I
MREKFIPGRLQDSRLTLRSGGWSVGQLAPVVLFLLLFAVVPLGYIFVWSFWTYQGGQFVPGFHPENYAEAFARGRFRVITFTVRFAVLSVLINLIIAYPVAYGLYRFVDEKYEMILLFVLLIPFVVSRVIRVSVFSLFLSTNGPLNQLLFFLEPLRFLLYSEFSAYMGFLLDTMPIAIALVWLSLQRIDESLLDASYDLGGSSLYTFRRVTLPLSAPGIAASSILMFVLALGSVIIPQTLGGPDVLTTGQMLLTIFESFQFPLAGALSVVTLITIVVLLGVVQYFTDLVSLFEEVGQ